MASLLWDIGRTAGLATILFNLTSCISSEEGIHEGSDHLALDTRKKTLPCYMVSCVMFGSLTGLFVDAARNIGRTHHSTLVGGFLGGLAGLYLVGCGGVSASLSSIFYQQLNNVVDESFRFMISTTAACVTTGTITGLAAVMGTKCYEMCQTTARIAPA